MTETAASIADGDPGAYDTLILGIGNILWADEGFGIRAIEALHTQFSFSDDVRLMDGGTQGIFLLPWVRHAKHLLIFDAIDFGLKPATLKLIRDDDVPRFMGVKKMSMHQTGFQEVLFTAELTGEMPEAIALVGVQPELLDDYGGSLRASVKAQIGPAIDMACNVLAEWGITPSARGESPGRSDLVGPGALDLSDYESDRPTQSGGTV